MRTIGRPGKKTTYVLCLRIELPGIGAVCEGSSMRFYNAPHWCYFLINSTYSKYNFGLCLLKPLIL